MGEDATERVRTKQALLQSERLAAIGRMSAVVAHEIRNPHSALGLNSELLADELEDREPAKGLLCSIAREINRLEEITEEYLRFARLPKPNLQSEDLNRILRELLFFLRSELEAASILAVPELRADPGLALVDEGQLHQAFMNLLKNSIQSMPDGGTAPITATERGRRMGSRGWVMDGKISDGAWSHV